MVIRAKHSDFEADGLNEDMTLWRLSPTVTAVQSLIAKLPCH
jgi:hypothetical protein